MKRILPMRLERFQNLISIVENNSITDFLVGKYSLLDTIEDDFIEFISFLKEYQEQYEFTENEKDSIRISLIRYVSVAIQEGIDYNSIYDFIW